MHGGVCKKQIYITNVYKNLSTCEIYVNITKKKSLSQLTPEHIINFNYSVMYLCVYTCI